MKSNLVDTLDAALDQLQGEKTIPEILDQHPSQAVVLSPLLDTATELDALRPVVMPAAELLLVDRNRFLSEITKAQMQPVSLGLFVRLRRWMALVLPWPRPRSTKDRSKEGYRMSAIVIKLILILTMIAGSTGGTAALAANSLPDSPLYTAKLALERFQLQTASGPADQASVHLELAQERTQEMQRLALAGKAIGEATLLQLQTHLSQAFQLAAGLSDEEMQAILLQARQMLQIQEQVMQQTQNQAHLTIHDPLGQALGLLRQARSHAEAGLQEPQTFRWQHAHGFELEPPGPGTPGGNPDCPSGNCEPAGEQHQNQHGPQPESPGPGEPGGNPDPPCTDCELEGEQHQNGPQPEQPGPGGPGGNPDPPCTDCDPAGEQNQNGPQPEPPGPGGNPDPPCTDCDPAGEQNQNGPQPEPPGPGDSGGNEQGPCTNCDSAGEGQKGGKP